jgi:hypothetical protein
MADGVKQVTALFVETGGGKDSPARIGTPPEFRDVLINMAKSVRPQ